MRVVWKFPLQHSGYRRSDWNRVEVGYDPKVVLTAIDPATGAPAVWIEHSVPEGVTPNTPMLFGVFGTGSEIDPEAYHVGSMIDRACVWHIYAKNL